MRLLSRAFMALGLMGMMLSANAVFAEDVSGDHPCLALKTACEAAGFVKGGAKDKKGLFVDCMNKLIKGEAVPGVTVSAEDIARCKEKHGDGGHHGKGKHHGGEKSEHHK